MLSSGGQKSAASRYRDALFNGGQEEDGQADHTDLRPAHSHCRGHEQEHPQTVQEAPEAEAMGPRMVNKRELKVARKEAPETSEEAPAPRHHGPLDPKTKR